MKRVLLYITDNFFSVVCILFMLGYLCVNFTTVREAILFLSCFFLIIYSGIFFNGFFRKLLLKKIKFIIILRYYWLNIILIIVAIILISILGSWKLLVAIFSGTIIYALMFCAYYLIKRYRA